MLLCKQIFIFFILKLIPIIFSTETAKTGGSNIDCSCPSEETFDSNLKEGVFKSPGFPGEYCGSLDCKWNILPDENTFIYAKLGPFTTEKRYDILDVYQTRWNGSELLKVKQASVSGETFVDVWYERLTYTSSIGGGLFFHFVTDGHDHNAGFEIRFTRYPKDDLLVYPIPCPQPFYYATNSTQYLPLTAIRHGKTCIFSINSTQAVKLIIRGFDSSRNKIEVFETESFPNPYVERQGGQLAKIERHSINSFPLIVTSRTHSMSILITSYTYELLDPHIIEFIAVKICECFPNNLIVSRVQPLNLLSPGFPLEYCDNLNCSSQISLENPLTITNDVECLQIQFNSFRTELDMDLLHLLQIPSGDEKRELISHRPVLYLGSLAPNSPTQKGKKYTDTNTRPLEILECLCHGTDINIKILNGKKNSLQNNFDVKNCLFMDCFWKIEPLKDSSEFNHRLLVKLNLSLSDSTEFVEVCADNFLIRNPQCHRLDTSDVSIENKLEFTVWQIPGLPYLDKIGPVYIWYHREFSLLRSEQKNNIPRQINFNYEWRGECKCGEVHLRASKDNWNVLYSPDHPENYCPSMSCSWLLEAPEGYHLVVNISEFYTETDHDFLALFDGNDTNQKHMEMLSGMITFKNTIHSTKNIMAILFNSDISIQMGGFAIWYRAELSSDNSSSPHRLFLFMFFTLFAVIGILFIIARSNPTNNRFTTVENIFRRLFPTVWTRMKLF
uniref:CUB domain-containing protein n=1 Tax=Meloidogyne floridensis TaxID=298350 RepID=A0A915PCZ2_9BILA